MRWSSHDPDEELKPLLEAREAGDVDALLEALGGEPELVPAAARLLAHAGEKRAVPPLVELLDSPRPALRLAAVRALGQLGPPLRARARITAIALGDPLPSARGWACTAIACYDDPEAAQLLIALLADRDRIVRLGAARALAAMGRREFQEPIAHAAPRLLREPGRWFLDRHVYTRLLRELEAGAAPDEGSAARP